MTKIIEGCILQHAVDVKALRQRLGISRDALAREIGVSYKSVYLWEKGKTKPSPLALEKLKEVENRSK